MTPRTVTTDRHVGATATKRRGRAVWRLLVGVSAAAALAGRPANVAAQQIGGVDGLGAPATANLDVTAAIPEFGSAVAGVDGGSITIYGSSFGPTTKNAYVPDGRVRARVLGALVRGAAPSAA